VSFFFDYFIVENNPFFEFDEKKFSGFKGCYNLTNGLLLSNEETFFSAAVKSCENCNPVKTFVVDKFSENFPVLSTEVKQVLLESHYDYFSMDT